MLSPLQKIIMVLVLICASTTIASTSRLPDIKDLSKLKISYDEGYRIDQHPHELLIAKNALIYGLGTHPREAISLVNGCRAVEQLVKAYRTSEKLFERFGITYVGTMWRILMQGEVNAPNSLYLFLAFSYHFDTKQGKILLMPTDNDDNQIQNIVVISYSSSEDSIPRRCVGNLENFLNSDKGATF